jgi:PAS domain S-box-containing protein
VLLNKVVSDQDVAPFRDMAGLFDAPPDLLEMLPIAVYACDGQGLLRWFNRRAAELWGRAPRLGDDTELFCGSFRLYGLDGQQISREETPMAHVLRTGEAVHGKEAEVERPDGTRVIAMVHIDPVKDAAGNIIGAINCFHETTELHDTKKRLAEGSELFHQLLEALPIAIYTTDAQGRVTFYNRAATEFAGRKPTLGTDEWCVTWRLFNQDGTPLPHDECPMAVALKENRPVRGVEAYAERPDGTRVPFRPFPTPLRDLSGKLVGAVNMLVDISDQKAAEAKQRILFDELNHRVKNNMQMLHSLLKAAERETQSMEARDVLSDAGKRVGAMAAAQQVLYSAENSAEFDSKGFLEMLCENARQAFGDTVDITLDADSGAIANDAAVPLSLILNELLINAMKHGRRDSSHVAIKIALSIKDNMWRLSVEDDGPGFVFREVTKRSSGLGLVTGLAHQLGGCLTVGNGKGALCVVSFPARAARVH